MTELISKAEEFENRKFKFDTTSDRILASREAKALILEINEVYKRNKTNLINNLLSYKEIYGDYILLKRPYYCMNKKVNFNDINLK